MSASPFGFNPALFGGPSDEDLARALALSAARMPTGFSGPPTAGLPEMPAQAMSVRPFGFGQAPSPTSVAPEDIGPARMPGSVSVAEAGTQASPQRAGLATPATRPQSGTMTVPLPPVRPAEFATSEADLPAAGAQPIMAAPAAPAASTPSAPEGPSFGDRMLKGLKDNGDYLGALGAGLLSSPTWAGGISAGMQLASKSEKDRAATDLARVELGLKQRKLAQETSALGGNAAIIKRAFPNLSDAEATAAGSNGGIVTDALKRLQNPNYGRENDPAFIMEKAKAEEAGKQAAKPDETYVQLPEQERVSLGLPAGAYQRDSKGKISAVNPTGTTINMGAEKAQDATVGKSYGEYQVKLATDGRNAANTLNSLALMEQAARNPNFYSGTGAETVKRANQFLVALGVKDANYTKPTEVFDALSNKVVLDGLGGSLGPGISNTDRDYIGRTAPTLAQSQAGNLELIAIARDLARRQQAVAGLSREYAAANGGRIDAGFDQKLEAWARDNPLFPAAQAAATQQSDGRTGANGPGGVAAPRTQADFDALPPGAMYVDPSDGKKYRKN